VQTAHPERRAILLIIRRSWVRAPPAPPAISLEVSVELPTGHHPESYFRARQVGHGEMVVVPLAAPAQRRKVLVGVINEYHRVA